MYLMYVDESGDPGLMPASQTRYFCLSGLVIHELDWRETLNQAVEFRKELRDRYGLKLREELHCTEFIHSPGKLSRIRKDLRLRILRDALDFEANLKTIQVINVVVDKLGKTPDNDIFQIAWQTLIQRFENTNKHNNLPKPKGGTLGKSIGDTGMLIVDRTDVHRLRKLSRKMGKFNHIPKAYGTGSFSMPTSTLIEDAVHRDSIHSYFIQLADVNAYFLKQKFQACGYVKRKGGRNYFDRLDPVLCKVASNSNKQGIVIR